MSTIEDLRDTKSFGSLDACLNSADMEIGTGHSIPHPLQTTYPRSSLKRTIFPRSLVVPFWDLTNTSPHLHVIR